MMMKRYERQFVEPHLISKHLYCTICHEVFKNPHKTDCDHTFCYSCVQQWIKNNKTCPICRKQLKNNILKKDLIPNLIIDDFKVRCNQEECEWVGRNEEFHKHLGLCQYKKQIIEPEWVQQNKQFIIEVIEENDGQTMNNQKAPQQQKQPYQFFQQQQPQRDIQNQSHQFIDVPIIFGPQISNQLQNQNFNETLSQQLPEQQFQQLFLSQQVHQQLIQQISQQQQAETLQLRQSRVLTNNKQQKQKSRMRNQRLIHIIDLDENNTSNDNNNRGSQIQTRQQLKRQKQKVEEPTYNIINLQSEDISDISFI